MQTGGAFPSIQAKVQDNLNRTDSGIVAKVQSWINEAKREIERRFDMEYMKANYQYAFTSTQTVPLLTLLGTSDTHRFKDFFYVAWRQTAGSNIDLSWTEIGRFAESEVLDVEVYTSPSVIYTGPPEGWTLDELNFLIHPAPDTGNTYTVNLWAYLFSTDWTFTGNEEPYLAKYAYNAVINLATQYGFDYMGEVQDAMKWEGKFEKSLSTFRENEASRVLGSTPQLVPLTGTQDREIHRRKGATYWTTGFGRI